MKSERQKLVKKLDGIFSKFIRNRDKNLCFTCGRTAQDAGHYIPRARMQFRFDEKNVNAQCRYCNWTLEGNKDIYRKKLIVKYGERFVEIMEADSHKTYQLPTSEIKILILQYEKLAKEKGLL